MNAIAPRTISVCAVLLVSFAAAASGTSTSGKAADSPSAEGSGSGRIVVEEDRDGNEVPPPAPSGVERRGIGDYIRDHAREVNGCYEKRVHERKAVHGKLIARFDIGPNGRVIGATADGMDDRELALCVVKVVRGWMFARPRSSAKLRVAYPWIFPPANSQ